MATTKTTTTKSTTAPKTATFGSSGQYTYKVDSKGTPYGNPISSSSPSTTSAQNTSMAAYQKANPTAKVSSSNFDPTTGALLNSNVPTTTLEEGRKVAFPEMPQSDLNFGGINTGMSNYVQDSMKTIEQNKQAAIDANTNNQLNITKMMQDLVGTPPSMEDAYTKARDDVKLLEKQQKVSDLTTQLGQITSQGQAMQQQVVGQGRGIPEAIIGGQQAQIARETAIQALPVSASLAAAQGNLEMANANLETLYKIKSTDLQNQYNFKKEVATAFKDVAIGAEKNKLDLYTKALDKQQEKEEKNLAEVNTVMKEAAKNGLKDFTVFNDAKTLDEALTAAGNFLRDPLDIQLKNAQIAKAWADAKKVDTTSGTLTEQQVKQIDNSPQGKKLTTLSGLYQKSQTYKKLVDTYGFKAMGNEKALIDSAYADLKIAYKEAANLGALTGPDVGLIEEAIKPASGAVNYLNFKLSGGQGGVSGAIDQALIKAKTEAVLNYKQLTKRNPNYAGSEYVKSLISPFSKDYNTVDLVTVPKGEIIETEDGILLEALGNGEFSPL